MIVYLDASIRDIAAHRARRTLPAILGSVPMAAFMRREAAHTCEVCGIEVERGALVCRSARCREVFADPR